jgi:hypothetical protein
MPRSTSGMAVSIASELVTLPSSPSLRSTLYRGSRCSNGSSSLVFPIGPHSGCNRRRRACTHRHRQTTTRAHSSCDRRRHVCTHTHRQTSCKCTCFHFVLYARNAERRPAGLLSLASPHAQATDDATHTQTGRTLPRAAQFSRGARRIPTCGNLEQLQLQECPSPIGNLPPRRHSPSNLTKRVRATCSGCQRPHHLHWFPVRLCFSSLRRAGLSSSRSHKARWRSNPNKQVSNYHLLECCFHVHYWWYWQCAGTSGCDFAVHFLGLIKY